MKNWCKTFAAVALFTTVCFASGSGSAVPQEDVKAPEHQLSAWVAYWDLKSGMQELHEANERNSVYGSVSYFAAYFNSKGKLFLPDALEQEADENNSSVQQRYLTVVNDVAGKKESDSAKYKDIDIVKKVLKDDKAQQKHADEIIRLAKKADCNGIDLDYEKVFRDKKAAQLYLKFIKVLYDKAQENDLQLRVILEPNVNFDAYKFPKGPEYMVMLYNLYGLHSGEGPKADYAFIRNTIGKMKSLPQPIGAALATGGCWWNSTGEKKFISAQQAEELAEKYGKQPLRSLQSSALHFEYKDKDGIEYKVWYADELTLASWINKAEDAGAEDICIWRLGSNEAVYDFDI